MATSTDRCAYILLEKLRGCKVIVNYDRNLDLTFFFYVVSRNRSVDYASFVSRAWPPLRPFLSFSQSVAIAVATYTVPVSLPLLIVPEQAAAGMSRWSRVVHEHHHAKVLLLLIQNLAGWNMGSRVNMSQDRGLPAIACSRSSQGASGLSR